jgi:hypothetical protein
MHNEVPDKQVAFLAAECEIVCNSILKDLDIEAEVDNHIVNQLTTFFLRDIYRIDQQQRGSVSLAKHAGYWAFWIRKLKPISKAVASENSYLSKDEIESINEVVAVFFAIQLVVEMRQSGSGGDIVRRKCLSDKANPCDGIVCFEKYITDYLDFENRFFLKTLAYSMRNRTFGPHHFALLIEGLIYSSCSVVSGGKLNAR